MDSTDLVRLQRRARARYEVRRALRALLGIAPLLLIVGLAAMFAHRPATALWFGGTALVASALMLFYGRDPQRAVLPGVTAGLVPLVLALCANHFHHCGPTSCSTLCVPACSVGGLVAGLLIAAAGRRASARATFWICASGLTLLTGAMGCSCVGYTGIGGLGLGFVAGLVPGLIRKARGAKVQ